MAKVSRARNSIRNIGFGLIYKILALILPFIARTVLIYYLGIQYVGLSSLFTSILSMLNLAELGVGSAIVFSMYDAVAREDKNLICGLLKVYKKVYSVIGCVILCAGLLFSPFLKNVISGEIPSDINLYVLYFIYLINTSLTYFLFAYKNCLFIANHRNDIISKISAVVLITQNVIQIVILVLTKNYYLYIIWMIVGTVFNNLIVNYVSSKRFYDYIPEGHVSTEIIENIKRKVKALFLYKVGGIVLTAVDSIVISAFLGLTILGKYNNYYFIITSLFAFLAIFYDSVRPGIGNSLVLENKDKNLQDFRRLFLLNSWLVGWCTVCLVCLYEPFMEFWVGEALTFPFSIVILLSIYFYIWKMMEIVNLYKDAAGMWEYDKYRPIVAATINLILNLSLVKICGIYGILISTIVAIAFVIFPWSTIVLFKHYYNDNNKNLLIYLKKYFYYTFVTIFACVITYLICQFIQAVSIIGLISRLLLCVIVPNIIYVFGFSMDKDFLGTVKWMKDKFNKNHEKIR